MRVDPRAVLLASATLLACAGPARSQGIYGTFQTQYQKAETDQTFLLGGGQTYRSRTFRELWTRALDMHQQNLVRPDLLLESNVRLTQQSILSRQDLTTTPQGSLRLVHPWFQLLASHQPATVRSSLFSQSGQTPDSVTQRTVTTRNTESLLNGHFNAPRWPTLDASWVRRRRDGGGSVNDISTTRSARLGYDRDGMSVYGSVNEDRRSSLAPGSIENRQQVFAAGASSRLALPHRISLTTQYDVSDVRGVAGGLRRPSTLSQSGSVGGDWRPSTRLTGTMNYQFRHIDFGTATNPAQTDQEAGLMLRWIPSRGASLVSGSGLRTVRSTGADGAPREDLQRYVMAVASLQSRVRRNMTGTFTASHTTSWDPLLGRYGVQTVGGSTRAQLTRRIQLDGSMQVTANGDTATSDQRISNNWNLRAQGYPLRTLLVAWSIRNARVGPAFWRASSVNRGRVLDLQWRLVPTLSLLGTIGTSESVGGAGSRSNTRSFSGRWDASRAWHWYGSWTHSDQRSVSSVAGALSSREVASGRVQFEPTRRLATSAGITVNEPGRPDESRQVDVALTWSFGR
jgi:hypothetical protein